MQEHLMQDDGLERSSQLPPGVLIEEKFSIYPLLCFLTENPVSLAHSLMVWDFLILPP